MKYNLTLAAVAALASVACPAAASAADYKFALTGDYTASWILSDAPELVARPTRVSASPMSPGPSPVRPRAAPIWNSSRRAMAAA